MSKRRVLLDNIGYCARMARAHEEALHKNLEAAKAEGIPIAEISAALHGTLKESRE